MVTIPDVATSITAFVGRARRGPVDTPIRVQSVSEYRQRFGKLWADAPLGYAVTHFFLNGGTDAIVIRVHNGGTRAAADVPADGGTPLSIGAADPGIWGNQLQATITHPEAGTAFHLTLQDMSVANPLEVVGEEQYPNLTLVAGDPRFVSDVLAAESRLAVVTALPSGRPKLTVAPIPFTLGDDGLAVGSAQVSDAELASTRGGLYALETTDLFNLLVIPPFALGVDPEIATWDAAAAYCVSRRALLLVDPPSDWSTSADVINPATGLTSLVTRSTNAAIYFPRVRVPDPLKENRVETFAPSGAIAGVIARTDAQRGVWTAPAGPEATVTGIAELSVQLTDGERRQLNPLGVNCLRTVPTAGCVVWGARTLAGLDGLANPWAYIPVRRTALFIEESLIRGTRWVVSSSNGESLWSEIRLNVGAFMHQLFSRGAFQGQTPDQAYFVKCDRDTNPQQDIDRGILTIIVGFAPLNSAEFVQLTIQHTCDAL